MSARDWFFLLTGILTGIACTGGVVTIFRQPPPRPARHRWVPFDARDAATLQPDPLTESWSPPADPAEPISPAEEPTDVLFWDLEPRRYVSKPSIRRRERTWDGGDGR